LLRKRHYGIFLLNFVLLLAMLEAIMDWFKPHEIGRPQDSDNASLHRADDGCKPNSGATTILNCVCGTKIARPPMRRAVVYSAGFFLRPRPLR
jgi:hypothetical protein